MSTFERDLELTTDNPLAEILLLDGEFKLVARSATPLRLRVRPGLYVMKVKVGDEQAEAVLEVRPDPDSFTHWLAAPLFESPVPLDNSSFRHQFQQDGTARVIDAARKSAGTAESRIIVCVRDPSPFDPHDARADMRMQSYAGVFEQFSVRDTADGLVAWPEVINDDKLRFGFSAMAASVAAGSYFLTYSTKSGDISLSLPAAKGWALQVYVNLMPGSSGQMEPDLAGISVFYDTLGSSFNPSRPELVAAETVRKSLAYGRGFVPPQTLDVLYQGKFQNPILGLYAAHHLIATSGDPKALKEVITNTSDMLGKNFPDVAALRLATGSHKPDEGARTFWELSGPPLLARSWQLLVAQADALGGPGVTRSPALARASSYSPQGIFTGWVGPLAATTAQAQGTQTKSLAGELLKFATGALGAFRNRIGGADPATLTERLGHISTNQEAAAALVELSQAYEWPKVTSELRRNPKWMDPLSPLQRSLVMMLNSIDGDDKAHKAIDENFIGSLLDSHRVPLQSLAEDLQQIELGGWMSVGLEHAVEAAVELGTDKLTRSLEKFRVEIDPKRITHRVHYAALVDTIFGAGSAKFDKSVADTNNVIGALASPNSFVEFKANFQHRLHRLNAAIQSDPSLRKEILAVVNRIVGSGWDGAYAELSALDYFLAAAASGPGNIVLDRTVPAKETLASAMGMQNTNYDMSLPGLGVVMDTKLLSDKIGGILEGVFNDFRRAKGIRRLTIVPSYDQDNDFAVYQANRRQLLAELVNGVDTTVRPRKLSSAVIPDLSYEFAWEAGVTAGASTYSPSTHAKNHQRLLFSHAKKFSRVEPTVIIFVLFPWAGESIFLFKEPKMQFCKAFGEEFFSGLLDSPEPASKFNGKFQSDITVGHVVRHLSGIIFLDDDTILAKDPQRVNVEASFVWNPVALHALGGSKFDNYMRSRSATELK